MNIDAAKNMIKEAGDCLEDAQRAYSRSSYNLAVRRSQEAVELALKGILRLIGVEYPKVHDVGDVFLEQMTRFSQDAENLKRIAGISKRLAKDREPSFYMERIYSEATAKEAVEGAQFVYEYIEKLIKSVEKKHGK